MKERLPFESELIDRIDWLIQLRWLAVLGTALTVGVGALWFPEELPFVPLGGVVAAIALYNLAFLLYFRDLKAGTLGQVRLGHATRLAQAQIVLDLVALAALVHLGGGVENPTALFFVFHVILASILLSRPVSYVMAGLASLLYAAIAGLEYGGFLPHHHLPILPWELSQEPLYLLAAVATLTLTLFLVTYLTTSLTVRLRERDRALMESNLTCQVRSAELAELNEELHRVDTERTRFMVLVTHELRAPLNTIHSALDLALSGYASEAKTIETLVRAQARASELLDLIRDLLDLTQVREQTGEGQEALPVQVDEVLREVVEFMRIEAEGKDLSLEVAIAPDLPPVEAHPQQIKLVWTNLLSNATKYNEAGGRIRVSLYPEAQSVVGEVADTGVGIAPKDLPHVFDEFFRGETARQVSAHGTGVGMAIVRRIIENWGGEIGVESEVGRGTTFTFTLPQAEAARAE